MDRLAEGLQPLLPYTDKDKTLHRGEDTWDGIRILQDMGKRDVGKRKYR